MTSSQEPFTLKRLFAWIENNRFSILLFLGLFLHGASLGLSDDEAYYWVLAQKPALGYAYHPPLVAWVIFLFQKVLGPLWGENSAWVVRLPAILCTSLVFSMSLKWISETRGDHSLKSSSSVISWVILSFFGLFFLGGWMMVPDLPLLFGWMITFMATWRVSFSSAKKSEFFVLGIGAAVLILSKFSGILAIFSSLICLWVWAEREKFWKGFFALSLGLLIGILPILIWNYQHEWGAILYQIQGRHSGGHVSWIRFFRFLLAQLLLAGPVLFVFLGGMFWKFSQSMWNLRNSRPSTHELPWLNYLMIWILPGLLVFFIQPLFSEFKLHWSAVVWWPTLLGFAVSVDRQRVTAFSQSVMWHIGYGLSLGFFILVSCHLPVVSALGEWVKGESFDPRIDVTHDFYGWSELASRMKEELSHEDLALPVTASRYQTAAQASFAFKGKAQVTLLPRDLKAQDEWPSLGVSSTEGPTWPRLTQSVLYVLDQRYVEEPHYEGASCERLKRFEFKRWNYSSKWIEIWKCRPQ